jgi:ABC-2 type transport system permease protein
MRKYIAVFRIRFSNTLQYRAAALAYLILEGLEFVNVLTDGIENLGVTCFPFMATDSSNSLPTSSPSRCSNTYPLLYLLGREQSRLFMFIPLLGLVFLLPSYAFFRSGLSRYRSTGS